MLLNGKLLAFDSKDSVALPSFLMDGEASSCTLLKLPPYSATWLVVDRQDNETAALKSDDGDDDGDDDGGRRRVGTCDWRLAQSTQYSHWNLSALGISTGASININGEHLGSDKDTTLTQFLAQTESEIRGQVQREVVPAVKDGAATTNMLIVDIEHPLEARPDTWWQLNQTTLHLVVAKDAAKDTA